MEQMNCVHGFDVVGEEHAADLSFEWEGPQ